MNFGSSSAAPVAVRSLPNRRHEGRSTMAGPGNVRHMPIRHSDILVATAGEKGRGAVDYRLQGEHQGTLKGFA
jgi:hypothetical protein